MMSLNKLTRTAFTAKTLLRTVSHKWLSPYLLSINATIIDGKNNIFTKNSWQWLQVSTNSQKIPWLIN